MNVFIFRRDLRLQDNTAFNHFIKESPGNSMCIFIFNESQVNPKKNKFYSSNAVQFMVESLELLNKKIPLNCYYTDSDLKVLKILDKKYKIDSVYFNEDITPYARKRDDEIREKFKVRSFKDYYLIDDFSTVLNGSGNPYVKFASFLKKVSSTNVSSVRKPTTISYKSSKFVVDKNSLKKDSLKKFFTNNPNLMRKLSSENAMIKDASFLSPFLKFGRISIREAYYHNKNRKSTFRESLYWRDFYACILLYHPRLISKREAYYIKYNTLWDAKNSTEKKRQLTAFKKWTSCKTGEPLVDASMNQLNTTGWMDNRCRMIVSVYLIKILWVDWRLGEQYFATKLIDYDPSSNSGGWQWSASVGSNHMPYFRSLKPSVQIKKYDPSGSYVAKWLPENYTKVTPIDFDNAKKESVDRFKKT